VVCIFKTGSISESHVTWNQIIDFFFQIFTKEVPCVVNYIYM
jgi:hypothetical protein